MFAFAAGKSQGRSEETRAVERVSVCNGVPGKSFEATLPAWVAYGEEFKKCVETVVARGERGKGSRGAKGPQPRKEREGGPSICERRHEDDI